MDREGEPSNTGGSPAPYAAAAHAATVLALSGRPETRFESIPKLLGRRIGGRLATRRRELRALAVESYLDGWINESSAAGVVRCRGAVTAEGAGRCAPLAMADEEQGHGELARAIVTWCFEQDPICVARALGRAHAGLERRPSISELGCRGASRRPVREES